MKLTNEEIQKNEKLLRDSSYAKYHQVYRLFIFAQKKRVIRKSWVC